jgi:hypothetical protein
VARAVLRQLQRHGIAVKQASDIVLIKRLCKAKVSYHFIHKPLERLKVISLGQFDGVQFSKLEQQLYGAPIRRR